MTNRKLVVEGGNITSQYKEGRDTSEVLLLEKVTEPDIFSITEVTGTCKY